MTRLSLRIAAIADRDADEVATRYNHERPGLGGEFLVEFAAAWQRIAETPLIYQIQFGPARRAPMHRFPYGVWYRIHATEIVVFAVLHGKRHPAQARYRAYLVR